MLFWLKLYGITIHRCGFPNICWTFHRNVDIIYLYPNRAKSSFTSLALTSEQHSHSLSDPTLQRTERNDVCVTVAHIHIAETKINTVRKTPSHTSSSSSQTWPNPITNDSQSPTFTQIPRVSRLIWYVPRFCTPSPLSLRLLQSTIYIVVVVTIQCCRWTIYSHLYTTAHGYPSHAKIINKPRKPVSWRTIAPNIYALWYFSDNDSGATPSHVLVLPLCAYDTVRTVTAGYPTLWAHKYLNGVCVSC